MSSLTPEPGRSLGVARIDRELNVAGSQPTLLRHASTILRYRFLVLRFLLVGGLLGALVALLSPRTYTSDFSFTPQEASETGGLSALASDLGMNVGGTASQSPAFYVDLLKTREVLGDLANQSITDTSAKGVVNQRLVDILAPGAKPLPVRRLEAMEKLRKIVVSHEDLKTNVVQVSVTTRSAQLSADLASRLIDELNRFNTATRHSQAAAERNFAEQRLSEARVALREAEDRDQDFLLRNMSYQTSPELLFAKGRLDREIALRQNEYQALLEAYNRARLDEVRNTPVITIVEKPEVAVRPDRRGLITKTFLAAMVGVLLALFVAFTRDALVRSPRSEDDDYREFTALREATTADFRHPGRAIRHIIPFWHRRGTDSGSKPAPVVS